MNYDVLEAGEQLDLLIAEKFWNKPKDYYNCPHYEGISINWAPESPIMWASCDCPMLLRWSSGNGLFVSKMLDELLNRNYSYVLYDVSSVPDRHCLEIMGRDHTRLVWSSAPTIAVAVCRAILKLADKENE